MYLNWLAPYPYLTKLKCFLKMLSLKVAGFMLNGKLGYQATVLGRKFQIRDEADYDNMFQVDPLKENSILLGQ